MKTVEDICKYIGSVICANPVCIETGCTYVVAPDTLLHTTTINIFKYVVQPKGGKLHSLDNNDEHIELAKVLLPSWKGAADKYQFWYGDSVDSMHKLRIVSEAFNNRVSLLCLDSKEFDEDHMVNEYNAIKGVLAEKHFVLVDDIHNPNSVKYKKMVPILKDLGYKCVEVKTPTGMLVASMGYKLWGE